MARGQSTLNRAAWLIAGSLAGGGTIFVAALGTRAGLWRPEYALQTLTFMVAPVLTAIGVICALVLAAWSVKRPRALGLAALFAVAVVGATAAGLAMRWSAFHDARPWDVTSDVEDAPGFSRLLAQRRASDGAPAATAPQACAGVESVPSQLAPERAAAALESAGFTVIGSAPFRAEGERTGFWFGLSHDAVVRIRPGRTDVRVTARSDAPQGDETCRLAAELARALAAQAGV